jgi:hypothetical protein
MTARLCSALTGGASDLALITKINAFHFQLDSHVCTHKTALSVDPQLDGRSYRLEVGNRPMTYNLEEDHMRMINRSKQHNVVIPLVALTLCEIKMKRLLSHKLTFLSFHPHVSTQTGHHQVILEESINHEGMHIV